MREPGGRFLTGLAGLLLIALGAALAYRAWQKDFVRQLRLSEMRPRLRRLVVALGQVGGIARGTVFAAAGIFVLVAAIRARPGQAQGLDATLRALAATPAGPLLLAVIAVGLIIFGIYSCVEARWRRI
jgi:membrane protease YdiL (CAAX protease family)